MLASNRACISIYTSYSLLPSTQSSLVGAGVGAAAIAFTVGDTVVNSGCGASLIKVGGADGDIVGFLVDTEGADVGCSTNIFNTHIKPFQNRRKEKDS